MVFKSRGSDEASHWAHIVCDPEYIPVPSSYSRGEKFKAGNGCNGCERESLSQLRGVFMSCVGIANLHGGACSNVGKALIRSVSISADPESAYTQIRPKNASSVAGDVYPRLNSAVMRRPMIELNFLNVTWTMKDSNECRKISISHRTRINLHPYLDSAAMREPTHYTNGKGQQQISEDQH